MLRSVYAYAPELSLELEAAEIAIRWQDFPDELCAVFPYKQITVEVRIRRRKGIPLVDLPTDCERDIIAFLTSAGRTTQPKIIQALMEKNHGDSTITKALARMVKDGRLNHIKRRGYAVAEVK